MSKVWWCVLHIAVLFAVSPAALGLTERERAFLTCVATGLKSYSRNFDPGQYCYSYCYTQGTVGIVGYDPVEYADGALKFLKHSTLSSQGLIRYSVHDWKGNQMTRDLLPFRRQPRKWQHHFETGFLAFNTLQVESLYNPDLRVDYFKLMQSPHSIRITIRIGNLEHRAKFLWEVVLLLTTTFAPEWFKIDTPGREREDSIIMKFHESESSSIRGPRSEVDVFTRLRQRYEKIVEFINDPKSRVKVGGVQYQLKDVLIGGSALPPFQYQQGEALASVTDYYYGASFGQTLCAHMTHQWTKSSVRSEIEKSLADADDEAPSGVVGRWIAHGHPTATRWEFRDPDDENFSVILNSENMVYGLDLDVPTGGVGRDTVLDVQFLTAPEYVHGVSLRAQQLKQLTKDLEDLIGDF